jgi:hypothetical protein
LFEDVLNIMPRSQEVQNRGHPDAVAFDAGLSEADFRVDGNAFKQLIHGGFITKIGRRGEVGKSLGLSIYMAGYL